MKTTCILCPVGCLLNVEKINNTVVVTGNECPRGIAFGTSELIEPVRMLTTLVKTNHGIASVKLSKPISKEKIWEVKKALNQNIYTNVKVGDVIVNNICLTNANVVITGFGNSCAKNE